MGRGGGGFFQVASDIENFFFLPFWPLSLSFLHYLDSHWERTLFRVLRINYVNRRTGLLGPSVRVEVSEWIKTSRNFYFSWKFTPEPATGAYDNWGTPFFIFVYNLHNIMNARGKLPSQEICILPYVFLHLFLLFPQLPPPLRSRPDHPHERLRCVTCPTVSSEIRLPPPLPPSLLWWLYFTVHGPWLFSFDSGETLTRYTLLFLTQYHSIFSNLQISSK